MMWPIHYVYSTNCRKHMRFIVVAKAYYLHVSLTSRLEAIRIRNYIQMVNINQQFAWRVENIPAIIDTSKVHCQ